MRKNNVEDMTVREQIEKISDDFCNNYCKWPDLFDEEAEGYELADSEHCANCPIGKLRGIYGRLLHSLRMDA